MFDMVTRITNNINVLQSEVEKAAFKSVRHAAASLRRDAIASIETSASASAPGTPINTRAGWMPNSITFDADDYSAVIGPRYSRVKLAATPHEFGGEYRGGTYPERSFMGPALQRAAPRFAAEFSNTIGE